MASLTSSGWASGVSSLVISSWTGFLLNVEAKLLKGVPDSNTSGGLWQEEQQR